MFLTGFNYVFSLKMYKKYRKILLEEEIAGPIYDVWYGLTDVDLG